MNGREVRRALSLSRTAWEALLVALRLDLESMGAPERLLPATSERAMPGGVAELVAQGIAAADGSLMPDWAAILGEQWLLASARGLLVARHGSVTGRTRVTIAGTRALVTHERLREDIGASGEAETLRSATVDLVLTDIDSVLDVTRSFLPSVDPVRALPNPADRVGDEPVVLGPGALSALEGLPFTAGLLPPLAAHLIEDEEAMVAMLVEAWPTPDRATSVWSKLWAVGAERLVRIELRAGTAVLTERPAGDVLAEFQGALVGALDAAATEMSA